MLDGDAYTTNVLNILVEYNYTYIVHLYSKIEKEAYIQKIKFYVNLKYKDLQF